MTAESPAYALQNASHSAALFRQAAHSAFLTSGVLAPGELAVTAQSTPNMSVQVAAGRAWMKGTQVANVSGGSFSTQAAYFGLNDGPVSLTIAAADQTNPRIDRVVAYVQDSYYSGSTDAFTLGVITGTPAASPSAPAVPNNGFSLASITVAANATSITSGNITPTPTASLLAITRGGIQPVLSTDTTAGTYTGQQRDLPTGTSNGAGGPQRWNGSTWQPVGPLDFPVAYLRQTTTQTFTAANTWYDMALQAEDLDSHNGHDGTTNPQRWTVPAGQAGTYRVSGGVNFGGVTSGQLMCARLAKNGTEIAGSEEYIASGTGGQLATRDVVLTLAVGDYVTVQGFTGTAGATTAVGGSGNLGVACSLTVERVR